jgi:BirA family biotin operon repressor/biotin-[acetyl-CoA-carboxylase] ligase
LLQFSVVLRPELPPADAGLVTTSIGVAVARGIEAATALVPNIKWPNDVTIGGKKVAGILVESRGRDAIDVAIAGIGINVNWARTDMPAEIADIATSISEELGRPFSRPELLGTILAELEEMYSWKDSDAGRGRLIDEASGRSSLLGEQVTVAFADGSTREGIARRITETGALELESTSGTDEISVGEVIKVRAQG